MTRPGVSSRTASRRLCENEQEPTNPDTLRCELRPDHVLTFPDHQHIAPDGTITKWR